MKKILFAILLVAPLLAALAPQAANAAPMTNGDVIKMVKGGLNEVTVIQEIDAASYTTFDSTPDDLVKLKQGGVSDAVIQRILARKGAAPAAAAAPAVAALTTCRECGTVTGVREIKKPGNATGMGVVAGGVLGRAATIIGPPAPW